MIETGRVAPETLRRIEEAVSAQETDGITEWRALLEEYPHAPEVLGPLAWGLASQGDHEAAIEAYREALSTGWDDLEMRWRIGDRLVNLGRLKEAQQAYEKALEHKPGCDDARLGIRYIKYLQRLGGARKPFHPSRTGFTQTQEQNKKLNEEEFEANKLRLKSLPAYLYLESTLKCNFFCKTCSKGYNAYYAEDLQQGIFDAVKHDVMPANTRISITGFGEPTMASNFDEIMNMALDNGSKVHFVTNASLLNFERLERLSAVPVEITISCDGATKETFEDIRAGSNWELFLDKLAMIKKLRDIQLSNSYSFFNFNFVAVRKNIHELPDVVRLAHRFGINFLNVTDYTFGYTEFDEESLRNEPERANKYLEEGRKVADELNVKIQFPPPYIEEQPGANNRSVLQRFRAIRGPFSAPNRFPQRCSSPWSEPYINTDGSLTPCCTSHQYLGTIKGSSFAKVWNGWRYRLLRLRIHSTVPPPDCRACMLAWGINGGNPGNVIAQEGLFVRLFYFVETRLAVFKVIYKWKHSNILAKLRLTLSRDPEPNFYQGRPISDKNRVAN